MTKQELAEMVDKAEQLAIKAHAGQKDKAGKDYFEAHVSIVANGIKGDPIAKAAAFLHDTVEDTSVTIKDIRAEFPKEVADAVDALTHRKGMSYAEYLWHIQQNRTAVKVKLSDLRSNMDVKRLPQPLTEKDISRTRKYRRAYLMLNGTYNIPYDCRTVNPILGSVCDPLHDCRAVNPYALYDYLLATGWEKAEKQKRNKEVITLNAPDNALTVTVPIDMTLSEYAEMMKTALDKVCCYENAPASDVFETLINWKPH